MTPAPPEIFLPLSILFKDMDKAWDDTAAQYGFACRGCEDNCCLSLFYHHTYVEKAYLLYGFDQLDDKEQDIILNRARTYCRITFSDPGPISTDPISTNSVSENPVSKKNPCPLLFDGKCRLYTYRPMICRMHGLPHELHRPGHSPVRGKGCAAGAFETQPYIPFDRTPFYREMARIEMAFRESAGCSGKIKESVAQILLSENRPWSGHPDRPAPEKTGLQHG